LEKLDILRATFYRWYDLYHRGGPEALDDRSPRPDRVYIYMYYISYQLADERLEADRKARSGH
jgi:hypothetical protein